MKYFTIKELCNSATAKKRGIDNTPTAEVISNLTALVDNVLDPLRTAWGKPLTVTSGYRCPALNSAVGGVKKSEHREGKAADIVAGSRADNKKLYQLAISLGLPFNQLIWEKGDNDGPDWVHISHSTSGNKRQAIKL